MTPPSPLQRKKILSLIFTHTHIHAHTTLHPSSSLSPSISTQELIFSPKASSEKAMAPHSSTLAWKIPWMEEAGGLQSMGSLGVWHDWTTSLSLFTFMHWRRKWQPSPEFLPGESQGWGEPGGLLSVGSHRVRHDWRALAAARPVLHLDFGALPSPLLRNLVFFN